VAEWLTQEIASESPHDLSDFILCLPGRQAGRRLEELVLRRVGSMIRPQIVTLGSLPQLFQSKSVATTHPVELQLLMHEVCSSLSSVEAEVLFPGLSLSQRPRQVSALASSLKSIREELALAELEVSEVETLLSKKGRESEAERWQVLKRLNDDYERLLVERGKSDESLQLRQAQKNAESLKAQLVLIGVVQLPKVVRGLIDRCAEDVTCCIHADENNGEGFDELGLLKPDYWRTQRIPVSKDNIVRVDSPAQLALQSLASTLVSEGEAQAIGLADERVLPTFKQTYRTAGIRLRPATGRALLETSPARLLVAVCRYLQTERFGDAARLVRHPDIIDFLTKKTNGQVLETLDAYFEHHLPHRLRINSLAKEESLLFKSLHSLLIVLDSPTLTTAQFGEGVKQLLKQVYGERSIVELQAEAGEMLQALKALAEILSRFSVSEGSVLLPREQLVSLLTTALAGERLDPEPLDGAIPVFGWLEMPLNDAPVKLIAGFEEGILPLVANEDSFLPDSLRSELGLPNNEQRFLRDTYYLSTIVRSTKQLSLLSSQVDVEGEQCFPSRLLSNVKSEDLAEQAIHLFHVSKERVLHPFASIAEGTGPLLRLEPKQVFQADQISITALKDYVVCPYQFYLQHVLKLEEVRDDARELSGAEFGSLAHKILHRVLSKEGSAQLSAEALEAELSKALSNEREKRFSNESYPAVRLQLRQLESRLAEFARWQESWVEQGWLPEALEVGVTTSLQVAGRTVKLIGRIDRVDCNTRTGERIVLDYKTGENIKAPEAAHFSKRNGWIDFQLPLYLRAMSECGQVCSEAGYITLGSSADAVELKSCKWDETQLAECLGKAREVLAAILAQKFWPPNDSGSGYGKLGSLRSAALEEVR